MEESQSQIQSEKAELLKELDNCSFIVDGLENYEPFKKLMCIVREQANVADDNWHKLTKTDDDLFLSLKSQKLALIYLTQIIDNLKAAKEDLQEQLTDKTE